MYEALLLLFCYMPAANVAESPKRHYISFLDLQKARSPEDTDNVEL
jgi:hypothetical protein